MSSTLSLFAPLVDKTTFFSITETHTSSLLIFIVQYKMQLGLRVFSVFALFTLHTELTLLAL